MWLSASGLFTKKATRLTPRDDRQDGYLAIYKADKAQGTEMPAIIGVLQEYVEGEEERICREQHREHREREKLAAEQRLLSGADCKWTLWMKTKDVYCHVSGRLFRLSPTADKRLDLYRVEAVVAEGGHLLGRYQSRTGATKAVGQIDYQPEPRWQ